MNEQTQQAIITVGDGRGFVVGTASRQLVITAAHCLPRFPPAASISHTEERNYSELLGSLGEDAPKVWAECLFADPIGDIAVLGPPDGELVHDEADAYDALTADVLPLRIAAALDGAPAWLLTLDRQWMRCVVEDAGGALWNQNPAPPIMGGMSGSPILNEDGGSAIGVVCSSGSDDAGFNISGPNPQLVENLPGWLLRELAEVDSLAVAPMAGA